MAATNATVVHVGPYGLTARLDSGERHPANTLEVQIHELGSPGVISRHQAGDRIAVRPNPKYSPNDAAYDSALDWVEAAAIAKATN